MSMCGHIILTIHCILNLETSRAMWGLLRNLLALQPLNIYIMSKLVYGIWLCGPTGFDYSLLPSENFELLGHAVT